MSTERFEEQVKTRVSKQIKKDLERIAERRHLDVSDIVREAFREYVARNDPSQLELAGANGKETAAFKTTL